MGALSAAANEQAPALGSVDVVPQSSDVFAIALAHEHVRLIAVFSEAL